MTRLVGYSPYAYSLLLQTRAHHAVGVVAREAVAVSLLGEAVETWADQIGAISAKDGGARLRQRRAPLYSIGSPRLLVVENDPVRFRRLSRLAGNGSPLISWGEAPRWTEGAFEMGRLCPSGDAVTEVSGKRVRSFAAGRRAALVAGGHRTQATRCLWVRRRESRKNRLHNRRCGAYAIVLTLFNQRRNVAVRRALRRS